LAKFLNDPVNEMKSSHNIPYLVPKLHAIPVLLLALAVPLAGCVTKAKATAQARAAYLQGQQDAFMRMQQSRQDPNSQLPQSPEVTQIVRIEGSVRNPVLPWRLNLTLAQAILDAGYNGTTDPTEILIVRNGRAMRLDVAQFLAGQDVSLLPGDVIRIK
jgi:hypothetical protein